MSFYDILKGDNMPPALSDPAGVSRRDVERALAAEHLRHTDFLALLSPAAADYLETMAEQAHALTLRQFGRTIRLYTPLYLSDHCVNRCAYCSFSAFHAFTRKKLSLEDVEREAQAISATGLRHLLILTGESRRESPPAYIRDCLGILRNYFHAVAVEIYPLTEAEYAELVAAGADGLTIYQETYDEAVYRGVHLAGPKRNFRFRLEAPERGAAARMREVSIGALLGLADWRMEAFFVGLHARYLMERYPDVDIGAAVPRLRPHLAGFSGLRPVTDRDLVQMILALRLFLPRLGISVSTREAPLLRNRLLPLGITRLSAGSVTSVGGHTAEADDGNALPQFEIADHRSVDEIQSFIRSQGYEPVFSDWIPHAV